MSANMDYYVKTKADIDKEHEKYSSTISNIVTDNEVILTEYTTEISDDELLSQSETRVVFLCHL